MGRLVITRVVFVLLVIGFYNLNTPDTTKLDKERYYLAKKEFMNISFEGIYDDNVHVSPEDLVATNFNYKNCRFIEISLQNFDKKSNGGPPYFSVEDNTLKILFSQKNGLVLHWGNTEYSLSEGMRVYKKSGDLNIYFVEGEKNYAVPFLKFLDIEGGDFRK